MKKFLTVTRIFLDSMLDNIISIIRSIPSWVWTGLVGGVGLFLSLFALIESEEIFFDEAPLCKNAGEIFLKLGELILLLLIAYPIGLVIFISTVGEKIFPEWMREKEIDLLLYMVGTISIAYFFFWW